MGYCSGVFHLAKRVCGGGHAYRDRPQLSSNGWMPATVQVCEMNEEDKEEEKKEEEGEKVEEGRRVNPFANQTDTRRPHANGSTKSMYKLRHNQDYDVQYVYIYTSGYFTMLYAYIHIHIYT